MTNQQHKALRIAALAVRILLGLFFIASAIAKLIDIDQFEIHVFSYNILSLNLSFFVARIIIVCELLVGIGLISNVFNRFVNICSLLLLIGFTIFLSYAALIGRTDSCQCMGSIIETNPIQSILKNAILILMLLFAMKSRPSPWQPRWFIWLPVAITPIIAVFCISAPDNWLFPESDEVYNAEEFATATQPGGDLYALRLDQGNHIVAFLSPGCQFCRMADEKLTYICHRNSLDSIRFINIIPTSDSSIAPLTIDTATFLRPSFLIPAITYAHITYGQRPMVFLVEDGVIKGTCHYRNIDEKRIADFLK